MTGIGQSPSSKKAWGLTQEAFEKLLATLDADRDRAGERYESLRRKLVRFFEWRGCPSPEDETDETLNRVARRIVEGEVVHDLAHYVLGVARMIVRERLKKREKERVALDSAYTNQFSAEESADTDQRLECLERCLTSLVVERRDLILRYYGEEGRARIEYRRNLAEQLRMPLNSLRIRAHRIRARLEQCVQACVRRSRCHEMNSRSSPPCT